MNLCKIGIHKYKFEMFQNVNGYYFGDSLLSRTVSVCRSCGKVKITMLNLGTALTEDFENLDWEPKYVPSIKDIRKRKLKRICLK